MNRVTDRIGTALLAGVALTTLLLPPAWAANKERTGTNQLISIRSSSTLRIPAAPRVAVPYRSWLPKQGQPRVVLLCVHALGFSSKSFDNFGRRMAAGGIPTYALDVRGFGQWLKDPDEAHMDFEACFTDVEQALKTLHKAYPRVPVFIVGESMGGAVAVQAAARMW